jgi:hypothetical protein
MKQNKSIIFITILSFINFLSIDILSIDKTFDFKNQYIPEKIEYEKERKICIFQLRNQSNLPEYEYLSNGLAGMIYSEFFKMKSYFDNDLMPNKIQYEYGKKNKDFDQTKIDTSKTGKLLKIITEFKETDGAINLNDVLKMGSLNKCNYMITGEYSILNRDSLDIKIEITERRYGKIREFKFNTSVKRGLQEFKDHVLTLKNQYFISVPAFITINTEPEDGFFVFIDGDFVGKTPLIKFPIVSGDRIVELVKENYSTYKKKYNLLANQEFKESIKFEPIPMEGLISIETETEGFDIYLGNKLIGKSPLINKNVPLGQNRIRITKDGYVDYLRGIEIKKDNPLVLKVQMKEGSNELYYKNQLNVFQDYNYFDFGMYSLYGSILFYGIYMYSGLRYSLEQDKLYQRSIFNTVTYYQGLANATSSTENANLFLGSLYYQQQFVDQFNANNQKYLNAQNLGIAGVFTMLSLSGFFFYKGMTSEILELGFNPPTKNSPLEATIQYTWKY